MSRDDDNKQPTLKVVSDNPNARTGRAVLWARERAQRKLAEFAASLVRTMAGSESEAALIPDRLIYLLDTLTELSRASGQGLFVSDVEQALRLKSSELNSFDDDYEYREWLRKRAREVIVQGALRLAAHRLLDERPHFGGKYSEDVIDRGLKLLEQSKAAIRRPSSIYANPSPRAAGVDETASADQPKPLNKKTARGRQRDEFSQADLTELRKAIKARDDKRIKELTSKIGKRTPEN